MRRTLPGKYVIFIFIAIIAISSFAPVTAATTERLEEVFGLEPHASRLANAFENLFSQDPMETTTENVSSRLLDLFFHPKYHRPLIGDW